MKKLKYWHEVDKEEIEKLCRHTWKYIRKRYMQPKWCTEHEALSKLGCWSLVGWQGVSPTREKISKNYCTGCPSFKN
jgi:hypothetical protein